MLSNRISNYLSAGTEEPGFERPATRVRSEAVPKVLPTPMLPPSAPANFAFVPAALFPQAPIDPHSWQAELYRMAYQAALASVAAAARAAWAARVRWN